MCKRKEKKTQRNVVMDSHIKRSRKRERSAENVRRVICVYVVWKWREREKGKNGI